MTEAVTHPDLLYQQMLSDILSKGVKTEDRTGVGTTSLFGYQLRFNLREQFPILTTKSVWWKGTVEELLWFLRGETSTSTLAPSVQKWWSPWARDDGSLGPIYGEQMRYSRWWHRVTPKLFDPYTPPAREDGSAEVGDLGTDGHEDLDTLLMPVWREMLRRCYQPSHPAYNAYGAKGAHVDPAWMRYPQFRADAQKLPGWWLKREFQENYSLDKDIRFASNRYSAETCMWASHAEQAANTSPISPDGAPVVRFRELDQIASVIASIKHAPSSRRHVINLWHSPAMDMAQLPCCHGSVIQFYVANGELSCHMYQRSADAFVGVPVNIASYSLLTHMIAQVCDLQVGDFVHSFGDLHIYNNHIDQVRTQLERQPQGKPRVVLDPAIKTLDGFTAAHISLAEYAPLPAILAPVAV